jgi:hypothetical protein
VGGIPTRTGVIKMDMEQEIEGLDLFQSLVVLAERLVELTGEKND